MEALLHDAETEGHIIGILIAYNKAYEEAQDILFPEMFYDPRTSFLFLRIGEMLRKGMSVDCMSLWAYINEHPPVGFMITVTELLEFTRYNNFMALPTMCDYLASLYKRRRMYMLGMKLMEEGGRKSDIPVEETITEAMDVLKGMDDDTRVAVFSAKEALQSLQTIVVDNCSGERKNGVPTGFRYFDERGGFQRGELIILGGYSSNGKSSMALDMAIANAKAGFGIAYYSMEMSKEALMARGIAAETGLNSMVTMRYPLQEHQWALFDKGCGALENLPLYFDESVNTNFDRIMSSVRTLVHQKGIAGAYIDYLQILGATGMEKGGTQEQFYGTVARRLKNLALELNIFVVILSQFNRPLKTVATHKPTVDMLRGSGQINEAADLTVLMYRPELYGEQYDDFPGASTLGTAEVIIGKGRNIGTGQFLVNFDGKRTHFSDIEGEARKAADDAIEARPFPEPEETPLF